MRTGLGVPSVGEWIAHLQKTGAPVYIPFFVVFFHPSAPSASSGLL